MDQAGIQAKVNRGYAKAAQYLGAPFELYRPEDPLDPLANRIGALTADFDSHASFNYASPGKYANPIYYGLFDGTNVVAGDYLIGRTGTWFVAGIEPNKPFLCVACNHTASFKRPTTAAPNRNFYAGDRRTDEEEILSGWPCSILQGTKGERGPVNLPADSRLPWTQILLPALNPADIRSFDRAYDEDGRVYTISSVERTNLGWRLTASQNDL